MEKYGHELEFISMISADGKSLLEHTNLIKENKYTLTQLSYNNGTYIASGGCTFVVKLKPKTHEITTIEQLIKVATIDNIHEMSEAFLEWLEKSIDTKETTFIWTDKK